MEIHFTIYALLASALASFATVMVRRERKYKEGMEEIRAEYRLIKSSLSSSGLGRRRPSNATVAKLAAERSKMLESLGLRQGHHPPKMVTKTV